ncbi:MAG: hypothetical protein LAO05_15240, partial [Acidobacteriia bacterium]|nr:hypothetical protein [Terriglobia bacterium]
MAWYIALGVLGALAALSPWGLGTKADPFTSAPAGIKPEWYFLFMFQTLKLIPAKLWFVEGEVLLPRYSNDRAPRLPGCHAGRRQGVPAGEESDRLRQVLERLQGRDRLARDGDRRCTAFPRAGLLARHQVPLPARSVSPARRRRPVPGAGEARPGTRARPPLGVVARGLAGPRQKGQQRRTREGPRVGGITSR